MSRRDHDRRLRDADEARMMMPEDEAKLKWCPMARAGDERGEIRIPVNRAGNAPDPDCYCIGSDCMAWRWNGDSPPFAQSGPEDSLDYQSRKGFCGAFGRPE